MSFDGLTALIIPPELKEGSYDTWKKELEIWKLMKTCTATEQGPILFRSIQNNTKAKNAALELTPEQIGSATGLELIIGKLDKVYNQEDNAKICSILEKFESFRRLPSVTMKTFALDFERLHNKVKEYKITYPDGVLAYRLLKSANMSKDHESLLRATVETGKWSYQAVLGQLHKIFPDISEVTPTSTEKVIKLEETYLARSSAPQESCPSYEECDSIQYNTFTDSEHYQEHDFMHAGPSNMESYAPEGYREPEYHDIYYGPSNAGPGPRKWGSGRPGYFNARNRNAQGYGKSYAGRPQGQSGFYRDERMNTQQNNSRNPYAMNPKDYRGNVTVCRKCRSTFHWWENCPHVSPQEKMNATAKQKVFYNGNMSNDDVYIALFQKTTPTTSDEIVCLMAETMNKAVIDSGCTKTCCGQKWYESYMDTLTDEELNSIEAKDTDSIFRFGDSPPVTAKKKVLLPMKIHNVKLLLETEVVPSDVPLLMSKETMKRAGAKMDFVNDKIELFGIEQPMICTSSGHYAIPIKTNTVTPEDQLQDSDMTKMILYTGNMSTKAKAKKLHTMFAHPTAKRLNKLVDDAEVENKAELKNAIETLTNECDICKIHKKSRPRPVVTFPLAAVFNETVGMDLKTFKKDQIYFLHMVDHATRLSAAAVIRSKRGEVIIDNFFKHWIGIFGTPQKVLSDNGGEFVNHQFIDMCQNLNINFMTTAAEAHWSNGLVEKANDSVGEAVSKIMSDVNCSVEVALCWAVNAKNSLQNIYGFSPYQLVFGRNPNLPSVFTDKLPALEGVSTSELVADHLNAMHAMRREFIRSESSEKIRRALRAKVRTDADIKYLSGEDVFYKREKETKWLGPARVIGQDGSKVLLKIPTGLITVHSCCVKLTSDAELKRSTGESCNKGFQDTEHQPSVVPVETNEEPVVENNRDKVQIRWSRRNINVQPSDTEANDEGRDISDEEVHQETEEGEEQVNGDNQSLDEEHYHNVGDQVTQNAEEAVVANPEGDDHVLQNAEDPIRDRNDHTLDLVDDIVSDKEPTAQHITELPRAKQVVQIKRNESDEWEKCQVLNRWGCVPGTRKAKHMINIKKLDDETEECINWEKDIKEWKLFAENILVTSLWNPTKEENVVLITSNTDEYQEAKEKEILNWQAMKVYDEVENEGQNFISVRWVLTEKEVEEKKVRKARLVARGYEEVLSTPTDSPTISKESQRVALSVISSEGWEMNTLDVKSAFLHSDEIDRDIYLKPPKEANSSGKLWKLKRCVYGLKDASRFWYFTVRETLSRLGCKNSKLDSSLFIHYTDKLEGLLIVHVDDFLFGGSDNFYETVISNLKKAFKISKECSSAFKYIGLELQQTENGIYVGQEKYLEELQEIGITATRAAEKSTPISEEERTKLRSVHGKLSWLAIQTRPDLAYDVCNLTSNLKKGTVDLILKTNKVIKKAKYNTVFLHYPKVDLNSIKVRCYTDASYGNLPDGGSQGGVFVEVTDGSKTAPIQWQSTRLKRTPKSTLAAETIALVEGLESAYLTSQLFSEILTNSIESVPVEVITDNLSLYEAAHSTTSIKDKRLRIELSIVRESISKEEIQLKWVKTGLQLADCLTKQGCDARKLIGHITGKTVY